MKDWVFAYAPVWVQNLAISIYNTWQYRLRHGGQYWAYREYFRDVESLPVQTVVEMQNDRLAGFLERATLKSSWYSRFKGAARLDEFPVLEKADLISNLKEISTVSELEGYKSLTGGTTGASMKVYFTSADIQERHALLDHFRSRYGYCLGRKVAWFSGKKLVRDKDISKGICYRDDWINNIRFFSTFHINESNFDSYWSALEEFSPDFIVGFPSSVFDICEIARKRGVRISRKVSCFFPTAETVLDVHRDVIGYVLGCRLADQYASSEGAPFILECSHGFLHIHPLSGIFEVVDENLKPARCGELLVTSFTTNGTPLIRYRIGDRVTLKSDDFLCECGSSFPVVDSIEGRSSDCVISPERGRVNLGNISNCTKDVGGIVCFQIVQEDLKAILVRVVASDEFDSVQESKFQSALLDRVGRSMVVSIQRVPDIAREESGKFRLVKNHLL